jgi:hypothetical protein
VGGYPEGREEAFKLFCWAEDWGTPRNSARPAEVIKIQESETDVAGAPHWGQQSQGEVTLAFAPSESSVLRGEAFVACPSTCFSPSAQRRPCGGRLGQALSHRAPPVSLDFMCPEGTIPCQPAGLLGNGGGLKTLASAQIPGLLSQAH